ncbi:MAG: translation initiation factor IF-1 [Bryobacteraceae bacterium]
MRQEQDTGCGGEVRQVEATVIELLPNAVYRLELDSRAKVIAHAAAGSQTNFVRLRVRDRVLVELSPRDDARGRIVRLLGRG